MDAVIEGLDDYPLPVKGMISWESIGARLATGDRNETVGGYMNRTTN